MESIDLDDGKNRCDVCGEEMPWQVHDLCERCRDLVFGTLAQNAAIADYWEHRAQHPNCDCP
jgi:hypothetical protein